MKFTQLIFLTIPALILCSCGENSTSPRISFDVASSQIEVGQTLDLEVKYENISLENQRVFYAVASGSSVSVSPEGKILALIPGVSVVRAKYVLNQDVFCSISVTVVPSTIDPDVVLPESIELTTTILSQYDIGETFRVNYTVLPATTTNKNVSISLISGDGLSINGQNITTIKTGINTIRIVSQAEASVRVDFNVEVVAKFNTIKASVLQDLGLDISIVPDLPLPNGSAYGKFRNSSSSGDQYYDFSRVVFSGLSYSSIINDYKTKLSAEGFNLNSGTIANELATVAIHPVRNISLILSEEDHQVPNSNLTLRIEDSPTTQIDSSWGVIVGMIESGFGWNLSSLPMPVIQNYLRIYGGMTATSAVLRFPGSYSSELDDYYDALESAGYTYGFNENLKEGYFSPDETINILPIPYTDESGFMVGWGFEIVSSTRISYLGVDSTTSMIPNINSLLLSRGLVTSAPFIDFPCASATYYAYADNFLDSLFYFEIDISGVTSTELANYKLSLNAAGYRTSTEQGVTIYSSTSPERVDIMIIENEKSTQIFDILLIMQLTITVEG